MLPLLLTFLIFFNTKTIAQVKETERSAQKSQWSVGYGVSINKCKISIDKNSTQENLEKEMAYVKEKASVDLKFSRIKRNKKGEIIAIASTYKTNDGKSGTYNISSDEPIDAFVFSITMDDNGNVESISYGPKSDSDNIVSVFTSTTKKSNGENVSNLNVNTEKNPTAKSVDSVYFNSTNPSNIKEMHVIKSQDIKKNTFEIIFNEENDSVTSIKEIEVPSQTIKIRSAGNSSLNVKPLYIIDGEIQDEAIIPSSLNPDNISHINILKGKNATSAYGDKAKKGVVEITTKQGKWKIENKNPLYIVDGRERTTISNIATDNIKNVDVLKSNKAKEKYGEKGKNGVVEITTKNN